VANGNFQSPFNPAKWGDAFTEGNSWHYSWSVFHDIAGLISMMGGEEKFNRMLDSVFNMAPIFDDSYYGFPIHEIREMQVINMGQYAHGNQPIQHMIYLYNYAGQPWKTQFWAREVMDRLYNPNPDGYCGDEDNGQTSAWYIFSALGFYPVCPSTDQYVLGAPLFKQARIHLENGKNITISAPENSNDKKFVSALLVNNAPYSKNHISHFDLLKGSALNFKMSATPDKKRGTLQKDYPYSYSTEK
jgi:predicted alpha-1,2-mannosidase